MNTGKQDMLLMIFLKTMVL